LISSGHGGWFKQTSGATAAVYGVAFSDAAHGWAVGEGGVIVATTNGGVAWSAQTSGSSELLTSVAFSDATHGWAVGWNGTILATTSGGGPSTSTPPSITTLKPASAKRGALVSISGSGFGAAQGTSSVRFGSKTCNMYTSWNATHIKCRVPGTAKLGTVKVTVTTAAGASNAVSFTVKR